ncbi:MAG TPA: hypothetical protein VGS08_01035 [Candidatus Saccharimonadales bacterium]|nr:hypothetical protein [Candidatus Saccharimonadales bacterium]
MSIGQMSIDAFLFECNQSPLLKDFRSVEQPITLSTLKEADFIKPFYTLADLSILTNVLYFIEPFVPKKLILDKSSFKDLIHWYEIGKLHNQKFIVGLRKRMGISHPNRGFNIDKDFLPPHVQDFGAHYNNVYLDDGFSEEYRYWFFKTVEGLEFYDDFEKWETATANRLAPH